MDFRSLDRMGDSDESILDEPYRPFYNIFAFKPVLVKQYDAPLSTLIGSDRVLETMAIIEQHSKSDPCSECSCLTTLPPRHETLLLTREVCACAPTNYSL